MSDGRLRRLARATGALVGIASLAGCPASGDDSDTAPATATGSDTDSGGDGAGGTAGTATPDCESRVADRQSELDRLNARIDTAETDHQRAREAEATWRAKRTELPGGHPDERIERARTVAAEIRESVVVLTVGSGSATGWFIGDGLVMTNAHNVAQFGQVRGDVTGYALDGTALDFEVVDFVEGNMPDVALLRTATTRPALSLAAGSGLDPGTPLVMVGHPGGVGYWVVSLGLFVSKGEGGAGSAPPGSSSPPGAASGPAVKTSAPGRQGNSGSPICTLDGEVVAMLNASQTRDQDDRQSTDLTVADPFVYDWPATPRAWSMGVPVETVRETYERWR